MGDHQGDDCSGDLKKRLETLYMTKSLANRLYLKKKLYTFHMHPGKSQSEHIDEFHKLVGDLAAINAAISDKDQALLLLTSLPSSYDNFVETLLYGRDTMKLEDVVATLNSRELQKMTEAKGDGGEGLYVRGRSGQNRYGAGYNHKKSQGFVRNEDQVFGSGDDGYDNADVMMAMSVEELLDWIMDSGSSYYITYRRDYLVDFKEECRVRGTGKVQVQMRDASSFVLDNVSLVCTWFSGGRGYNHIYISSEQGTWVSMKVRNTRKTFIGSGVGISSVHVLQGVKFEVELQEDHTFEVEPHGNVDHVAGSQEVQTQDLIYYHSARDREQHLAWELFSYREDNNEAAFAVAVVEKIYAHESLTFNNIVDCELIFKWKAGLKDDMDSRLEYPWLTKTFFLEGLSIFVGGVILGYQGTCDGGKRMCGYVDNVCSWIKTVSTVFVDFDYVMGRLITVMGRSITCGIHDTYGGCKGGYLAKVTCNRVMIRANRLAVSISMRVRRVSLVDKRPISMAIPKEEDCWVLTVLGQLSMSLLFRQFSLEPCRRAILMLAGNELSAGEELTLGLSIVNRFDHVLCFSFTDVAQVADAARNLEILSVTGHDCV
ncbi:hypothetical protein Tco_1346634 [Tanacetum coccineum]